MPQKATNNHTVGQWLTNATRQLRQAGIATARLDALILLADCTELDRSALLAHPETQLTSVQQHQLALQLARRANHEPLAYIRGRVEFYGRNFAVNSHVLVPRPESETMIELLKTLPLKPVSQLADVCAGSGALGLTAKLEYPRIAEVHLYDIDAAALRVARRNANQLQCKARYYRQDLLLDDHGPYQIILANLPYVPDNYPINEAAKVEPSLAIFGGNDGLDLYRRLFEQLHSKTWRPQFILTESLPSQHRALAELARHHEYELLVTDDFVQVFKPTD